MVRGTSLVRYSTGERERERLIKDAEEGRQH